MDAGRVRDATHRLFHVREPVLPLARQRGRLLGDRRDFVHRADQLLGRGRNLPRGGADLGGRRRDLAGRRLLLFGGRGDLGDRRVDLDAGLLHLTDQSRQLVGHAIESLRDRAEFVIAFEREAARQIACAHHVQNADQPGEELTLGLIGVFGSFFRLERFLLRLLARRDVDQGPFDDRRHPFRPSSRLARARYERSSTTFRLRPCAARPT